MRHYELMVILDPSLDERTVQPSLETFLNVIRKDGGSVEKIDIWGKRRLAYEIAKNAEGIYAVARGRVRARHGLGARPSAQPERVRAAHQGDAARAEARARVGRRELRPPWLATPSSPSSAT